MKFGTDVQHLCQTSLLRSRKKFKVKTATLKIFNRYNFAVFDILAKFGSSATKGNFGMTYYFWTKFKMASREVALSGCSLVFSVFLVS